MGYCHTCGCWDTLDPGAMCAACLSQWRPPGPPLPDLGTRT